jgi:hypothetical protein
MIVGNCIAAIVDALSPSQHHILSLLSAIIHTPDVFENKPILKGPQLSHLLEFETFRWMLRQMMLRKTVTGGGQHV